MSTIASPRVSTSVRSPSSSRTSLEIPTSTTSKKSAGPLPRRNRAALRDYYGLKGATSAAATDNRSLSPADRRPSHRGHEGAPEPLSELDKDGFDAEMYVRDVLAKEGLEGVLKVEADLVSQIRTLDGDRKSLVYDNYSKLIAATDTIRKMRSTMDPLAPTTHTLSPAISHIAELAANLSAGMLQQRRASQKEAARWAKGAPPTPAIRVQDDEGREGGEDVVKGQENPRIEKRRETVRWALSTPARLRRMIDDGQSDEAQQDWDEIRELIARWEGVGGVEELRQECQGILQAEVEPASQ